MRTIRATWFTEPAPGNFGDILTPYILGKYGYEVSLVRWNNISNSEVIAVGSIARLAKAGISVLGSGILSRLERLDPAANWVWVRGPITRGRLIECGGNCDEIYGDMALLLPRIYAPKIEKTTNIGLIPHHVDYDWVKAAYKKHKVINLINGNVEEVIDEILSCERVISSSLHGIIVANAYGIPAAWAPLAKLIGDDTKFYDYAASVSQELIPSSIESPVFINPSIDTVKIHEILVNNKF